MPYDMVREGMPVYLVSKFWECFCISTYFVPAFSSVKYVLITFRIIVCLHGSLMKTAKSLIYVFKYKDIY